MSHQFSPEEQAVLRIVQANLPDSLTPYADLAEQAGMTEAQVLELLGRLKGHPSLRGEHQAPENRLDPQRHGRVEGHARPGG